MDAITDRLTKASREKLLRELKSETNIDFTASNIYGVITWAIKNANRYFDTQLVEVYKNLSKEENVTFYKSNKKFTNDQWRFNKQNGKEQINYTLDYRIVHHNYNAIEEKYNYKDNHPYAVLGEKAQTTLKDILTIAKNLGFNTNSDPLHADTWEAGKPKNIYTSKKKIFVNVKAHKNGNIHLKFSIEFMKALNIEAGRLNGWLKTPKEAAEATGATQAEAKRFLTPLYSWEQKRLNYS